MTTQTLGLPLNLPINTTPSLFDFSFEPGTTLQQMVGIEMAGLIWSSYLQDNTTINIHIGVTGELPSNVIGGALPGFQYGQSYQTISTQLSADAISLEDLTAINGLATIADGNGFRGALETSEWTIENVSLTNANAKALGLTPTGTDLDGYILFSDLTNLTNTSVQWSYDYVGAATPSSASLDFLSTALHEIGHTLGFVSNIDFVKEPDSEATYEQNLARVTETTPLDLFRFSEASAANGEVNLAAGSQSYFSLDGGNTVEAQLAAGEQGFGSDEDGYQTSHFKSETNSVLDPALRLGQVKRLTNLDLTALDVIGWDVARPTAAPIRIEAESLANGNLKAEPIAGASGGAVLTPAGQSTGTANFTFNGPAGLYDVVVYAYDENDGEARLQVHQGNTLLSDWTLHQQFNSDEASRNNFVSRTVAQSLSVNSGDVFSIGATKSKSEQARVDYIEFVPRTSLSSISTLYQQAEARLADRLGQSVSWLNANPTLAAQLLAQGRIDDVTQLIESSQIYEWGTGGSGSGSGSGKGGTGGGTGGWGQVIDLLLHERLFQELELPTEPSQGEEQQVPTEQVIAPIVDPLIGQGGVGPNVGNSFSAESSPLKPFEQDGQDNGVVSDRPQDADLQSEDLLLGSSTSNLALLLPDGLGSADLTGFAIDPLMFASAQNILSSYV